jgi:hypothetical protein
MAFLLIYLHITALCIMGGGESRAANSDRRLVLGVGMSRRTGSRARPRRAFFSDSDSDSDSDEAFQISHNLGHVQVEFFCVLVQQLCPGPQVFRRSRFEFFRKFTEIFKKECLSPVSTTPAISCSAVSTTPAKNL